MTPPTTAPPTDGRRTAAAARRRKREAEIIAATRELFDRAGVRDAQIDQIAKAVGVNRAIVYRHFTGKEELFALTLVQYLDELQTALKAAPTPPTGSPGSPPPSSTTASPTRPSSTAPRR
jgi:AcrR family transcriptional regulator